MSNTPGAVICTGTEVNIGTVYKAVIVDTPNDPPRQGFLKRLKVTLTGGTGTAVKARVREISGGRVVTEYDDSPTNPGDPIPGTEIHFADTELWYDRGVGDLSVDVAVDAGADTSATVEVEVKLP